MENKSTGDLQQELMEQPNLNAYIHDNQEEFSGNSMLSLLSELFTRKNLSKAAQALPGPAAVHLPGGGGNAGRGPEAAQTGGVCPPLSQAQAGGHRRPRYRPPHAAEGDQRQAVHRKRENAVLRRDPPCQPRPGWRSRPA